MSIDIRVTGSSNLSQVQKDLGKLALTAEATTKAFERQQASIRADGSRKDMIHHYRQWNTLQGKLRDDTIALTKANGNFSVSSLKVGKDTDAMVERIQKQQLTFRQLRQEMGLVRKTYEDQMRLQRSYARSWGTTAAGNMQVDLITPNFDVQGRGWDGLRTKVGFYNEVLKSVSTQTVNWGKNTQWAGRQLMAGITYPLSIAAGLMAKTAYDVDKGLTQIVKVYGDANSAIQETDAQIREAAMSTASNLTQYGQSVTDTLEIQSQLASTGKTGKELQDATEAVTKARLLGELDIQDAMRATINMQEVYGFGADKLAEKFNFMNQMENETSLTMQDFVEGIPKISGIMKSLEAPFEDIGVLLAAMKTAGIDAKEGGNAIKSMVFKDIAPSAKALRVFNEATGESLTEIVEMSKGKPIETLQGIGAALEGLPGPEKVAIIKEVFGIHQGSKALGMIESLTAQTGQMAKAFSIANSDASEWADTARGELETLKEADWVKVKKAIEDVKIGMVEFGKVILTGIAPALQVVGNFLKGVGESVAGLSDSKKTWAAWALAIGLGIGPLIMLMGLMANLAGNLMKGTSSLLNFAKGQGLVTSKQQAAILAAQVQTKAVDNLTKAYERQMFMERELMRENLRRTGPEVLSGLSADIKSPTAWQQAAQQATVGYPGQALGMPDTGKSKGRFRDMFRGAAKDSGTVSLNSAATERSWSRISGHMRSLAFGAGVVGSMATSSDSIVNKLSNALFIAGLLGPTIMSGLRKAKVTDALSNMGSIIASWGRDRGAAMASSKFGGAMVRGASAAKTGFLALGSTIAGLAGPIGIAAVAAGGLFYMYKKRAAEAKAQQEALNNSVETFGSIVGANIKTSQERKPEERTALDYEDMANQLKDGNEEFAKAVDNMKDTRFSAALEYATEVGNEMRAAGASAEEAAEAARVAAVAINSELANSIKWRIKADMFIDIEQVKVNEVDRVRREIIDVMNKTFEGIEFGKENDGVTIYYDPDQLVRRMSLSDERRTSLAEDVDAAFSQLLANSNDTKKQQKVFDKIVFDSHAGLSKFYEDLDDAQKRALKEQGVFDGRTLQEWMDKHGGQRGVIDHLERNNAELNDAQFDNLAKGTDYLRFATIEYLKRSKEMTQKDAEKAWGEGVRLEEGILSTFENLDRVASSETALAGAFLAYRKEVKAAEDAGKKLTYQEELQLLNKYRLQEGLRKTTNLQDGMNVKVSKAIPLMALFSSKMDENSKKMDKAAKSSKGYYDIMSGGAGRNMGDAADPMISPEDAEQAAAMAEDMVSRYQGVMSSVQDDMFTRASEEAAKVHEGRIAAIERAGKAASDRLDAEQERKEAQFDAREDALDKAFEKRQDKFDARWERTMDMFDSKWEEKSDKFAAKWDDTMDRFDKRTEQAKQAVEDQFDARIAKIDEAIKAEKDAEEIRQRIFEREKARMQHLADMANRSIDINMSINSGNLDEAAKLSNDAQAAIEEFAMGTANEDSQSGSDKRVEALEAKKTDIDKLRDAEIERIEAVAEADRKALEERRKNAEKAFEISKERAKKTLEVERDEARKSLEQQRDAARKRLADEREGYLKRLAIRREESSKDVETKKKAETEKYEIVVRAAEKEMDTLRAFVPRNERELREHIDRVEKSYGQYGGRLEKKGQGWSKTLGESLLYRTKVARNAMESEVRWDKLGKSIASRMTESTFNMSMSEFMNWIGKGADPKAAAAAAKAGKDATKPIWSGRTGVTDATVVSRHSGGIIDGSRGSRVGYSGNHQSQSEVMINALRGESVLNRRATRALGRSGVDALNRGAIENDAIHERGDSPMGMTGGLMAMAMSKAMIQKAIAVKGAEQQALDAAVMAGDWTATGPGAGKYGGSHFGTGQLLNAATIASVGRSLGASPRDIMIALMTAIVESGLRNVPYGDRDSLGIFQQRAAWGPSSDRMDVAKSARMFFTGGQQGQPGLFDKKNRANMSMGQAAQAVQVSAFPDRYAMQEDEARAIYNALKWDGRNFSAPSQTNRPTGNVWPGMGWRKQFEIVKKAFPTRSWPAPNQTTGGGHASTSYHYRGRAVDLGSSADRQVPLGVLFDWLYRNYGAMSTELIYGPAANRNIKNGKRLNYGAATNAAHMNHIHWAMRNGGLVPGIGSGDKTHIMGEPGEFMLRKKAVDKVGPEYLKMLNSDKFVNMPDRAVSGVSSRTAGSIDKTSVSEYNINIDATGSASPPEDIARAVENVIHDIQRRKGFERKIGP